MKSSYKQNNFDQVLKSIIYFIKPKCIVEFGILECYSLNVFLENKPKDCKVFAYDLFEDYPFNAAKHEVVVKIKNVVVVKKDFYKSVEDFEDNSIDLLHIDISNDRTTYEFAINNYINKLTNNGVMLLEGGSVERDNIEWMLKYNKPKINPYLQEIKNDFDIIVFEKFPSLTCIRK